MSSMEAVWQLGPKFCGALHSLLIKQGQQLGALAQSALRLGSASRRLWQ